MGKDPRTARGHAIEAKVAEALRARGLRIRAMNYACRQGELDIVAQDGDCIVVVEVRSQRPGSPVTPRETVTRAKMRRIVAATNFYLMHEGLEDVEVRYDIAEVYHEAGLPTARVTWIKGAFNLDDL